MAKEIAQAVFENNPELIYAAFAKALGKGQAFAFQVCADRAYGKLKETHEQHHVYEDVQESNLQERVAQLERECYPALYPSLTHEAGEAARTGGAEGRTRKANGEAKTADVLSR